MKIAVNTRLLQKNKLEGIGTFTDESLKRIVKNHPEIEFHFLFDRAFDEQFIYAKNVIPHIIFPPTRHVLLIEFWMNYLVPKKIKQIGANAFISPDSIGFSSEKKNPNHLVVHDINFFHRPQDLPKNVLNFYLKNTPKYLNTAHQIATVSEYSKQDIINSYGISENKIDVVFNAAKSCFKTLSSDAKTKVKQQISHGKNYFLYVGSLHPRKNLNNLILAFDAFKKQSQSDVKLVVVGEVMWQSEKFSDLLNNLAYSNEIIFTGRKSDSELSEILGAALALTYVPFFEGFGIPIVEAFASGVPVITSNSTCMPEIAGDAALLVNPSEVPEITLAMVQLAKNEDLRSNLIEKGTLQNQIYSWDKTADLYWKSIKKTL